MKPLQLCSCLAPQIQEFIALRQLSGTDYHSQALLLAYFDHFLAAWPLKGPPITKELTDAYQQSLKHLAPRGQYNRFSVVVQLCRYLSAQDPRSYVPQPLRLVPAPMAHRPYIYTHEQVTTMLAAAAELTPAASLRPHTYRTLLGLLYSTGLRVGEALGLNLADFHAPERRLFVAAGKFHKARWVALAPSTTQALQGYLTHRSQSVPNAPDAPVLLNLRGRRLQECTVNHDFHRLLAHCGIAHQHSAPRVHDLRHTFAVHRLLAWYHEGRDVNALLPALATYMGHVDIRSTRVYLQPTAELLAAVDTRFHDHFLRMVKPQGGHP